MRNRLYRLQKELITTVCWQALPSFVHQAKATILANRQNGVAIEDLDENLMRRPQQFLLVRKKGETDFVERYADEDDYGNSHIEVSEDEEFVNVVEIDGAITRNGGACSVGSRDTRDTLIAMSRNPNCIGHIFMLNSPGGSASSAYDYEQGINAVRAAGQPCIGLIDGICASACTRLAVKLDEVYYTHPDNEIGCIGTMAIFYTSKNGDTNDITHEVYHELYANASSEKNGEFRQSAEGDDSAVIEMLDKENDKFLSEVRTFRTDFAGIPEDKLKHLLAGKMFSCKEMEGYLVDGQNTFEGCVERILNRRRDSGQNVHEGVPVAPAAGIGENKSQTLKKANTKMDLKFKKIQELIGSQENVTEAGFFLNADNAEVIDDKLTENGNQIAELTETNKALQTEIDNLKAQLDEANKNIGVANVTNKALTEHNEKKSAEHATEVATLKESYDKQIADLNETIKAKDALLAQKDSEIEELSHAAPKTPVPAPATAQTGEGDGDGEEKVANISDMKISQAEKIKMFRERLNKLYC